MGLVRVSSQRWPSPQPKVGASCPALNHPGRLRRRAQLAPQDGSCQWKVTATASVKFEVATPSTASRYQSWNRHVSPGWTTTAPLGWGRLIRSTGMVTTPLNPEFCVCAM